MHPFVEFVTYEHAQPDGCSQLKADSTIPHYILHDSLALVGVLHKKIKPGILQAPAYRVTRFYNGSIGWFVR